VAREIGPDVWAAAAAAAAGSVTAASHSIHTNLNDMTTEN